MMTDFESAARAAVQITRAAPLFDQLVTVLLSHAALAAEASSPTDGDARQAELRATRERLDAYYPEFQNLYFQVLRKHLGARLPAVLDALSDELVQAYFKAQKSMEHELISELQKLADEMVSVVPLDASPSVRTTVDPRSEPTPRATTPEEKSVPGRAAIATPGDRTASWRERAAMHQGATLPLVVGTFGA